MPQQTPTRDMTEDEKAILREGIAAARVQVTLDRKTKRVTDPRIAALAAMERPY